MGGWDGACALFSTPCEERGAELADQLPGSPISGSALL